MKDRGAETFELNLEASFWSLCEERTSVTPDTAQRLSKALGTSPEFWLNLQTHYDLLVHQAVDIDEIKPLLAA